MVRFRAWLLGSVYTSGAAAIVVREDGRVLLVKPTYRLGWGLAGGFLRRGEQPMDAVRRELTEEVGLALVPLEPVESYVQLGRRHIDHLFVAAVPVDQEASTQRRFEIRDTGWFELDALPP